MNEINLRKCQWFGWFQRKQKEPKDLLTKIIDKKVKKEIFYGERKEKAALCSTILS